MRFALYQHSNEKPPFPEWFKVGSVWKLKQPVLLSEASLDYVANQTSFGLALSGFKLPSGSIVVIMKTNFSETALLEEARFPEFYGFEIRLLSEDGKVGDRHLFVESETNSKEPDDTVRRMTVWTHSWKNWNRIATLISD
jgi:hypothetical protein